LVAVWLCAAVLAVPATAGEDGEPAPAAEKTPVKPKAKKKVEETELQEPEELTLTTEDGLKLEITYFAGTRGKQSIPVVCLHPFKGSRKDFTEGLAPYLQKELGCAVVVPDLRGHGESREFGAVGKPAKKDAKKEPKKEAKKEDKGKLDAASMPAKHFPAMIVQDMRAIKDFLLEKNNAGELNINKTCLLGVELGAAVALGSAEDDAEGYGQGSPWYGNFATTKLQRGEFVKAVVLVSPKSKSQNLDVMKFVKSQYLRSKVSVMILAGEEEATAAAEAKKIHDNLFKLFHRNDTERMLWLGRPKTRLQGMKLLDEQNSLGMSKIIGDFITVRLVEAAEAKKWSWREIGSSQ
jgi:pimeloyl-ACP methyl ester carboxylesterase